MDKNLDDNPSETDRNKKRNVMNTLLKSQLFWQLLTSYGTGDFKIDQYDVHKDPAVDECIKLLVSKGMVEPVAKTAMYQNALFEPKSGGEAFHFGSIVYGYIKAKERGEKEAEEELGEAIDRYLKDGGKFTFKIDWSMN